MIEHSLLNSISYFIADKILVVQILLINITDYYGAYMCFLFS